MQLERLCVLSQADMAMIHEASADILARTGVLVKSPRALQILEAAGAGVDRVSGRVTIPPALLNTCLQTAPNRFPLCRRDGSPAFILGDGVPRCASGHNALYMIDAHSHERRNSTVQDVVDFTILSDRLDSIDIVGAPLMPQDVTPAASLLYAAKALFENTDKPLFFSTESAAINQAIIRMMRLVSGSNACSMVMQLSPTSPLLWTDGAADAVIDCAREGVILNILPEPMSGISAPNTVAGLLCMCNAEVLSGVVLAQLAAPGAPVLYGSSWTTFDMKYAVAVIGSAETDILRIAGCQMARYYNLPSHTTAQNSDSNAHDEQNAWEKALSNLCAIGAGNDIVMNSGMFATGLTVSLEQLVLDDQTNAMAKRICRGMEVSQDTLARDLIHQVGPGGSFLREEHTLRNLRSGEFLYSDVVTNASYERWVAGQPDIKWDARHKVDRLLAAGNQKPLPDDTVRALAAVIQEFEAGL